MSGKWLLKRVLLTLALAAGCAIFLAVVDAEATPIRPDIRKIVNQPHEEEPKTIPARAGWDGPEMAETQPSSLFASTLSSERLAHARRAELIAAATPDPRAILGITAVIFLLRLLRQQEERRLRARPLVASLSEENTQKIAA